MQSHIGRTGSCADCHQYITTQNYFQTPGLVHLYAAGRPELPGHGPELSRRIPSHPDMELARETHPESRRGRRDRVRSR